MHIYNPNTDPTLPLLGSLRSRVLLLQNFPSAGDGAGPYGVAWDGAQMVLEDLWIIPDVYHLAEKWTAVREAFERVATEPRGSNAHLFLSHLSASVGVLPIEAAAGPMNRTIAGINDMVGQWLRDFEHEDVTGAGIVIIDFPGKKLIDAVLAWNEPLKKA
jgi:1-phosphatidylinositol phosphodiesterase